MCLNKQWKAARAELTPTLQTTCMLDCLATIKTTISYLQKLRAEDSLPHVFDQLTFSSFKNQTIADQKACNNVAGSKAVKPCVTDLLMDLLLDLSSLMCDEMFFMDCRSTAGMAILLVLNILCSAENFVTTVGQLIFPSHVPHGEIRFSILGNLKKMSAFQCSQDVVSFSHLCLCNGVLTMVSPQALVQSTEIIVNGELTNGTLMFDALFPDLCCLCDGLKDSSSCLFAFRTLTLWASQARQIASNGRYDSSWLKSKLYGTSPIPTKLLSYVWSHWDHPVEGVRYQTKVICEHVVNLHLIVSQNDSHKEAFLKDLTDSLLKVGWHVRGKYAALCCIASVVGAKKILLWFPTVPQEIYPLMRDRCLVPHVMDLVEKMANCHKQELKDAGEDIEAWEKTWMAPLLYHVHHGCKLMREHLAQYCLPKLLKCCPKSLQYLIKNLQGSNVPNSRDLGTLITCLKTARSAGLMSLNKNTLSSGENVCMWCGVVPVELMKKALCHLDDQIRLAAFGLLCDSTKTTESVTEVDLQLLQLFWPLNMNNQSPSFRQQAGAHFKKFLLRLKECLRISIKNLKQDKRNTDIPFYQHQLTLYREFLRWFCSSQFDSLFPGASITRRTTALCNLMLMKQVFGFDSNSAAIPDVDRFNCSEAITTDNVFILLDCLSDSYDVNKTMAYDIILGLPSEQLPFQEEASCLHWLNMIERLVSSPRAVDSSSAAMFLRLFVERCRLPLTFQKPNGAIPSNDDQESESLCDSFKLDHVPCTQSFRVLSHLVDLLKTHSSTASRNLSLIGIQAPMHGVLYCLRSIISHTSLSSVADDEHWQNLMSILVTECLCTADIVAPVITSDSPEGCMADDIQGSDEDILEIPDTLDDVIKAPASQLLLVCCWRTMKEVALLLGELSENAPLQVDNNKHGLLTAKQLHNIGAFFTKVLLNSKHRGAFELAYTGFAKLCAVMWRSVDKDFRQLPEKWLHSLLDDLTSDNPSEQLCGTRRSAGVPFFIQAIVTTEPPAAGRACFKQVMKKLLEIAFQPIEETRIRDSTLPQVHACNILRALYRETKLGEDVFPFVSDGVVVAITGFHSNSWAMRNSSTLLFSALVTRVFGVKRTKDEHSKSNCMTGREFFSRFPELHSFLLSQLQVACQGIDRDNTTPDPSLYPVLVILCRLYPSTMDGVDSALNIATFVPFVISCRKSIVMKTRMMSARAVVPLVTGDSLIKTLQKLLQSLPASSSNEVRQNEIHGTLLHIYHLLNGHVHDTTMSSAVIKQIVTEVIPLLSQSAWIGTRSNPCALSRSVFLNIVLNFVVDQSWLRHTDNSELIVLAERNLQSLKQSFERMAIEETTNGQYCPALIGEVFVRKALAEICLKVCEEFPPVDVTCLTPPEEAEKTTSCSDVILTLLRSSEYEVRMAVLEFIIIHFPSDTNISRDYEVDLRQSTEYSRTDSWVFGKLDSRVKSELFTMAMEVEHHTECLVKVFQALSLLSDALSFPWILSSGNQISAFQCWTSVADLVSAPSQRDSLKSASLRFLSRVAFVMNGFINSNGQDTATATQAMEALSDLSRITLETSSPSESEELRLCTAQVLGSTHVTDLMVDRQGTLGDVPFVLWSVLVKLLYDDEPVVRERMALGFASLLKRIQSSWIVAGLSLEGCAMVAPLSLESAMLCVWSIFIARSPLACVSWMLEWIRGDLSRQTHEETDELSDVDRLFEKGPLNLYAEDCIVTRAACKTVKQGIEMNNVLAVLTNKEHKTGLIELLTKELERCICFLESLLLTKLISNRNCFSHFYRAMAGLAVTVMLTQKVNGDMSSFESRISAIIRTLKMSSDTGGLSRHSMIIECMKELDAFMFL